MTDEPAPKQPLPIVTIVLATVNIAVFLVMLANGNGLMGPSPSEMIELGGNYGPITFDGQSWRLLTNMFLHYGVVHIGMNMFGLIDSGRHIERRYGRAAFLAIYLFSGLAGSFTSAKLGNAVSAGASGAVFGIIGAWGAYLLAHRKAIDTEVLRGQVQGLAVFLGLNIWFGLTNSTIDMRAHLGGLVAGFGAGYVLATGAQYAGRVAAVFVACGLVIGAAHVVPPPQIQVVADLKQFAKLEEKALDRYNALVNNDKLSSNQVADIIEQEVLPTWREAKTLVWSLSELPSDTRTNLRAYVDTREKAWAAMVPALRKDDQAGLAEAMNMMGEAEKYAEKLKR